MDFKKATDSLFERVTHADLAKALKVSVASIRQGRLNPKAEAHRPPPAGWEKAILRLAEERERYFRRLVDQLRDS